MTDLRCRDRQRKYIRIFASLTFAFIRKISLLSSSLMLDEKDYGVRTLCFILVDGVVVVVIVNHGLGHARKISKGRSPMIGCNTVT